MEQLLGDEQHACSTRADAPDADRDAGKEALRRRARRDWTGWAQLCAATGGHLRFVLSCVSGSKVAMSHAGVVQQREAASATARARRLTAAQDLIRMRRLLACAGADAAAALHDRSLYAAEPLQIEDGAESGAGRDLVDRETVYRPGQLPGLPPLRPIGAASGEQEARRVGILVDFAVAKAVPRQAGEKYGGSTSSSQAGGPGSREQHAPNSTEWRAAAGSALLSQAARSQAVPLFPKGTGTQRSMFGGSPSGNKWLDSSSGQSWWPLPESYEPRKLQHTSVFKQDVPPLLRAVGSVGGQQAGGGSKAASKSLTWVPQVPLPPRLARPQLVVDP